ncbi:Prophage tail length tape measure protein [Photorhabdus australis subsp. thailandensis]|uniref:Prophage tail length tape measure protein n=1 Tax=Photorhabdus australis subsp. thailandensis TaxID=2805096 RepID=A0A1C0U6M3_9GAMM|nr:phage tail tape measure protein [Photorhabdus australis]OCQ53551.1 Prophage tail length tape measure protein [Photorhabdus australis subsp. thailandensis]
MSDIATISLRVNTADLERGNQELNKFQSVAENASKASSGLNDQFKRGIDSQRRTAEALKEQRNELEKVLDRLNPTNKAFAELDKMAEKLNKARDLKIINETVFNKYNAIIESTNKRLYDMEAALTEEGRAKLIEAQASKRAETAAKSFLDALKLKIDSIGKTKTELLELKAAQSGVSQQAAPFIAKLKQQDQAFMRGAITAGQYKMAMHQLPMQVTDIVTSLASGMPIWLIAIQQGGQIKDSFGGIGNTFKALTTLITPMRIAMAGLVGVVGTVAYAYYKGSEEFTEYNKQLILTGNYAGKTALELNRLARAMSGDGITQGNMAATLAEVVGSGSFTGSAVEMVAKTAAKMEKAVGQSVDETIKQFQRLQDEPTKASEELNKKLHYLTSTQYEYISSLERRGEKELAGKYATETYARSQQDVTDKVTKSMGLIEKAAKAGKKYLSEFWDAALDIGRERTDGDELNSITKRISELKDKSRPGIFGMGNIGDGGANGRELAALEERKKILEFVISSQDGYSESQNKARKADESRTESLKYQNDILKKAATWQQKRALALKELWREVAKAPDKWSGKQRKIAVDAINKQHKEPKEKKYNIPAGTQAEEAASRELLALQSQLKVLKDHKSANDVISTQRQQLWAEQAKFSILEEAAKTRKLKEDEKSLLLSKETILAEKEKLANIGDQIEKQKQLNIMQDTATKFIAQQKAATNSILSSAGVSDREGKRNREREQLKLSSKNPNFDKMKAAQEDRYKKEDELRGNWELGFKKGFAEYQDAATNVYGNVANISQNAFQGMSNSFSDFLTTGKANFKDFATSILKQITQMITQMLVFKAIEAGASAFGFSLPGMSMSSGGYTGHGGKFEPRGIVHGGEFVFTKEATSRIGVSNLYGMMHSAQGYANGGYVGSAQAPISQVLQPAPRYGLVPAAGGVTVQTSIYIDGGSQQKGADAASIDMSGITKQINGAIDKAITVQLTKTGSPLWNATYGRR